MKKTEEQLFRKCKRIQKRMIELNDPKRYQGREMTKKELMDLYDISGQWQMCMWITGKYNFIITPTK